MIQQGINLTWNNVSAQIDKKQILKDISGYCTPGSMLAIMGASGSGKTTLLSVLARKNDSSMKVQGTILANNTKYNLSQFYHFASYVYQNDILNEALTVKQTLQFTAKLKIGDRVKAQQRVEQLIKDFELQKCQNTYVGGKFIKGISGGQKKRVCIAVEMVNKPDLLILDEPTSGLDSHMAFNIIRIFKRLVNNDGKTIIFTIHQPSFRIFNELDRLLLLNKGQCIYQGLTSGITSYMDSLEIQIPKNSAICDYFMYQTSQYKLKYDPTYKTPLNSRSYEQKIGQQINKQIQSINQSSPKGYRMTQVSNSFFSQIKILLGRQLKLFTRNPMKFGRAIGNSVLMIVMLGIIFLHAISDNRPLQGQLYPNFVLIVQFIACQGATFIPVTSIIMTGIFSVALVFPVQREVFTKQVASKTYNTLPYFLSKVFVELFTLIFSVVIFASGIYWLLGYTTSFDQFVVFIVILCSIAFVGNSIGLWTGSLFKDAQRSSAMAPAFLLPLMMFSGLYNKLNSIPTWIGWLQYISPFRYGLHAVLLNEFHDQKYKSLDLKTGQINTYDYKQDLAINLTLQQNVLVLLALAMLYYSLSFIFLKKLNKNISA